MTRAEPDAPRRSDFEEHLGDGVVRIFEGHPAYCPISEPHAPHEHKYRYLDDSGMPWRGYYNCQGDVFAFSRREGSGADDDPAQRELRPAVGTANTTQRDETGADAPT